jgi:hypothetical protein
LILEKVVVEYLSIPSEAPIPGNSSQENYLYWVSKLNTILPNQHGAYVIAQLFAYFVDQAINYSKWTALTTNSCDYPEDVGEQNSGWVGAIFSSNFDSTCPFNFCHEIGYFFLDPVNFTVTPTTLFFNQFIAPAYGLQEIH